jgi:importin subunit beta-1
MDPSVKLKIKESLMLTLGSSVPHARYTSLQVISSHPRHLEQNHVNVVLTAVVQGMSQTKLSPEVRLAGVKALLQEESASNLQDLAILSDM